MIEIKVGDKVRQHYVWNGGETTGIGVVDCIENGIIYCEFGPHTIEFYQDSFIQVGTEAGYIEVIKPVSVESVTFVIRDESNWKFNEPCTYRSVHIALTKDQLSLLKMNVNESVNQVYFENILKKYV